MAELVAETPHPPDGNVGGDPKIPDPSSDPGEDERVGMPSSFERAHLFGHGLFEYGETWA